MTVAAFDFDGTLTAKDTFLEFIKHSHGKAKFWTGFLLLSPVMAFFKAGIIPNCKAKQIAFSFFYKGWDVEKFNGFCESFSARIDTFLRKQTNMLLKEHITEGDHVIIISASIENWLRPWAEKQGVRNIAGTKIEVVHGKITGRFASKNCYGAEKVSRLLEIYPEREKYTLFACGDSRGDRELLNFADKSLKI